MVKFATENIKAKFIAFDFSVKRAVTFGVVPYCNQCPVNCIWQFAGLHIGSSIRYKHTLVGNYFLKSNKIKQMLISFNCFS